MRTDFTYQNQSPLRAYDPNGYLDIYYLLDSAGHVAYFNGSPSATMGQLLDAVARVGAHA
jgi:hypothetical protein